MKQTFRIIYKGAKTYDVGGTESFSSIQQTSDGGYIAAGEGWNNRVTGWIIKLDTNGNIQWQKAL